MSLTKNQTTYLTGSVIAGAVFAILFGILAANSSGGNQVAYITACVVCALAGIAALIYLQVKK